MLVVLKLESRTVLLNSFRFECLNKGLSPFHWLSFKKFSSQDAEGKTLTWRVRWSVFLSWNLFPIFTWEKAAKQLCVCVGGDLKMPSLSFHFLKKAAVALAAPMLAISSCICPPFPCKVFLRAGCSNRSLFSLQLKPSSTCNTETEWKCFSWELGKQDFSAKR